MIVVLMGAPGAGKGTQGDLLVKKFDWKKVSTGDLLREKIKEGGPRGKELSDVMNRGELVSDNILIEIIDEAASRMNGKTLLLDGFPRNVSQAKMLDELSNKVGFLGVFHLCVESSELIERLTGRLICDSCGASFHKVSLPSKVEGVCDQCDGKLVTRADDSLEKIQNRLKVYETHTRPVVDFYKERGRYFAVDGQGSSDEILGRLSSQIDKQMQVISFKE